MLENLLNGAQIAFSPPSLLAILVGVSWGILGGALPGITGSIATALLLPFTWGLPPEIALMMLAGVYVGAEYGGSIPAILLGTPGTSATAATVLDGYTLHRQGKSGKALGISLITGTVGGLVSVIALTFLSVPLARVALAFGPAEYFALAVLGLAVISSLAAGNVVKGLASGLLGLFFAVVGLDPVSAVLRYTFGSFHLIEGFEVVPVLLGLFALGEVFHQAFCMERDKGGTIAFSSDFPSLAELKSVFKATMLGSVIGTVVGAMPGAGGSVAQWIAYGEAKRWSRNPQLFGKGSLEGVAAPESANNAVTGGALIPTLALGIPGSNTMAILLGALIIHGLVPGPLLFEQRPAVPYSLFSGMFLAQIFMLLLGLLILKPAASLTRVRRPYLLAGIMALVFVGAYSLNNNPFDMVVVLVFGLVGFGMRLLGFSPPAAVLGFVLGTYVETNLRRALTISGGDFSTFVTRPISAVLLALTLLSLFSPVIQARVRRWLEQRRALQAVS